MRVLIGHKKHIYAIIISVIQITIFVHSWQLNDDVIFFLKANLIVIFSDELSLYWEKFSDLSSYAFLCVKKFLKHDCMQESY